jgi:hypothetical protein
MVIYRAVKIDFNVAWVATANNTANNALNMAHYLFTKIN